MAKIQHLMDGSHWWDGGWSDENDEDEEAVEWKPTPFGFQVLLDILRRHLDSDRLEYAHRSRFGRFLVDCHGKPDHMPIGYTSGSGGDDELRREVDDTLPILWENDWDITPTQWAAFLSGSRRPRAPPICRRF